MSNRQRRPRSRDRSHAGAGRKAAARDRTTGADTTKARGAKWRGPLVLAGIAVLAVTAGFVVARVVRFLSGPPDHPVTKTVMSDTEPVAQARRSADAVLTLPVGFPLKQDTPLPATYDALRREVKRLLDYLAKTHPRDAVVAQIKTRFPDRLPPPVARDNAERRTVPGRPRADQTTSPRDAQALPIDASHVEALRKLAASVYVSAARVFATDRKSPFATELLWQRAADLDPNNIACRQALAELCRRQHRPAEAIIWLRQLTHIAPANSSHWLELGRLYDRLGQIEQAATALQEACRHDPNDDDGYAALAELYLRHDRDIDTAVAMAKKAVALSPTVTNHARLASAYDRSGDGAAALQSIEAALKLAPGNETLTTLRDMIQSHGERAKKKNMKN